MANQTISLGADLSPLNASLAVAAKALDDFAKGPVTDTSKTIESAITKSFDSVANTIARAAVSGKSSMDQMVNAILADLERVALKQFVIKPVEDLISSAVNSAIGSISGSFAGGGPVQAGQTYLVGEQGPELFVPSGSGSIVPNGATNSARPQIVLNVQARDAQSFMKSEPQLAAMMARALARGQRNM
ncbi:MAG TPA: phage tail tape measure C-terminal domain-containing protein [Rhizomicrobium sp.]|nr:phage tail tape measure C-terminal domain-containing protein [Rhizomicrobium sp.]